MGKTSESSLVAFLLLGLCTSVLGKGGPRALCAGKDTNVFVGLAADPEAYESIPGGRSKSDPDKGPQSWTFTKESTVGPVHSLDGVYLQVLPDSERRYPESKEGEAPHIHLTDPSQLKYGEVPAVKFRLFVEKSGWHTLFLRWTGGDTQGGGDSLYVTLTQETGRKRSESILPGRRALTPSVVPIDSNLKSFAGCCYDSSTHACPCHQTRPPEDDPTCPTFVAAEDGTKYGIQCPVGPGVMRFIDTPRWYLFAGHEFGESTNPNAMMDFDTEPWDATCEAEGSNTKDSGRDNPIWDLSAGSEYTLTVWAREDGTALDAIYVAGPDGTAPGLLEGYKSGDSTFCPPGSGASSSGQFWKTGGIVAVVGLAVMAVMIAFGREDVPPAQWVKRATQRLIASRSRFSHDHNNMPQEEYVVGRQYAELQLNEEHSGAL